MAKYHIGRGGKPAQCSAKKNNCPFGIEAEHFKTREEAQRAIEEKHAYTSLKSTSKNTEKNISIKENSTKNKYAPCPAGKNCLTNRKTHVVGGKQYEKCKKFSEGLEKSRKEVEKRILAKAKTSNNSSDSKKQSSTSKTDSNQNPKIIYPISIKSGLGDEFDKQLMSKRKSFISNIKILDKALNYYEQENFNDYINNGNRKEVFSILDESHEYISKLEIVRLENKQKDGGDIEIEEEYDDSTERMKNVINKVFSLEEQLNKDTVKDIFNGTETRTNRKLFGKNTQEIYESQVIQSLRTDASTIRDNQTRLTIQFNIDKLRDKILNIKQDLNIDNDSFDGDLNKELEVCREIVARDYTNIDKALYIEKLKQDVRNDVEEYYTSAFIKNSDDSFNKTVDNIYDTIRKEEQERLENLKERYSY